MNAKIAVLLLLNLSLSLIGMDQEMASYPSLDKQPGSSRVYHERPPEEIAANEHTSLLIPPSDEEQQSSFMRRWFKKLSWSMSSGEKAACFITALAATSIIAVVLPVSLVPNDSEGWNPPPSPPPSACPRVEWNRLNVWADSQAGMTSRKDGIIQGGVIECQLVALNNYPCTPEPCNTTKVINCAPVSWEDASHPYILMGDGSMRNISSCTAEKGLTGTNAYVWCIDWGSWIKDKLKQFVQQNTSYCKTELFGNEFGVVVDEEDLPELVNMTKYQGIVADPSLMDEWACTVYKYSAQLDANCAGPIVRNGNDSSSGESIESLSFES